MRILYGLLVIPAIFIAMMSSLILDAPWAEEGWGAIAAWFVILSFWAIPLGLLAATIPVQRWHYALLALLGFFLALLLARAIFSRFRRAVLAVLPP
jgi:hypothetical protein